MAHGNQAANLDITAGYLPAPPGVGTWTPRLVLEQERGKTQVPFCQFTEHPALTPLQPPSPAICPSRPPSPNQGVSAR